MRDLCYVMDDMTTDADANQGDQRYQTNGAKATACGATTSGHSPHVPGEDGQKATSLLPSDVGAGQSKAAGEEAFDAFRDPCCAVCGPFPPPPPLATAAPHQGPTQT
jgi:hypothetical protein